MKESTTYQAILEEGRQEGVAALKTTLLHLGQVRFGSPAEPVRTTILNLNDLEKLERLTERLLTAPTWKELLKTPSRIKVIPVNGMLSCATPWPHRLVPASVTLIRSLQMALPGHHPRHRG